LQDDNRAPIEHSTRQMNRRRLPMPVMIVLTVLLLPVLVPAGFVGLAIHNRRKRKAAQAFACVECCGPLGHRSITLADKIWADYVRDVRKQNPTATYRMVQPADAVCPACGATYAFDDGRRTLEPVPRKPPYIFPAATDSANMRSQS
jgi:hypothetical protein